MEDAAKQAGASRVELILEPVAAAIGAGLPTGEPVASMVLDIGGGTSETAVISYGDPIVADSVRVPDDKFDAAIVSYLRKKYGVLIGETHGGGRELQIGSRLPA